MLCELRSGTPVQRVPPPLRIYMCNQNCDQGKTCDCREYPPMWETLSTVALVIFVTLSVIAFNLLCLGYWWYRT